MPCSPGAQPLPNALFGTVTRQKIHYMTEAPNGRAERGKRRAEMWSQPDLKRRRHRPPQTDTVRVFGIEASRVRFDGARYFVPAYASHRPVSQRILDGQLAEVGLHRLVARVLGERIGSMIHAGTFFGDMLPNFAAKCPRTVYAFEPVIENYLLARRTVLANRLGNVRLVHAALSDRVSIAEIQTSVDGQHHGGASNIVTEPEHPTEHRQLVPTVTIDSLRLDDLALLQLDVEGHELPALVGAIETIRRCRPIIVIEDNRANCGAFLDGLGYRVTETVALNTVYNPVVAAR